MDNSVFDPFFFPDELRRHVLNFLPGPLERIMWQRTCKGMAVDIKGRILIPLYWAQIWAAFESPGLARLFYLVLKEAPAWLQHWRNVRYNPKHPKGYLVFNFRFYNGPNVKLVRCGPRSATPNTWLFKNSETRRYNAAPTLESLINSRAWWYLFVAGVGVRLPVYIMPLFTGWEGEYRQEIVIKKRPYEKEDKERVYMPIPFSTERVTSHLAPSQVVPFVYKGQGKQTKVPRVNAWNKKRK